MCGYYTMMQFFREKYLLLSTKNKIGHFVLFKRKCKNTTFLE